MPYDLYEGTFREPTWYDNGTVWENPSPASVTVWNDRDPQVPFGFQPPSKPVEKKPEASKAKLDPHAMPFRPEIEERKGWRRR